MVDVNKAIIAKLKKGGDSFEVLVDCDNAIAFNKGEVVDIQDVLASEQVFTDSKKGMIASEKQMEAIFGTSDPVEVAKIVIKDGEIGLTADYKNKLREQKRKQIISLIHLNAVDPKTNIPHPPTRIENAFVETKVKIDENKSAKDQIEAIVKQLRTVMPISIEVRELNIKIPSEYAGKVSQTVRQNAKLINENWQSDGSLHMTVEIPAGLQEKLEGMLNNITKGNVEISLEKTK